MAAESSGKNPGTVLVTGATDGLGRATAILLARRGYRVFGGGRNAERRATLDQLARDEKLPLESIELDVCDEGSGNRAVAEIERRAGPVDILVNNAGIAIVGVMEEVTVADLHRQFETNFFGLIRMTQRVLPEMRRLRRGRVINMSSIAGKMAGPVMGPYSASKHALEAVSDAMRLELYPFGIQVVLIEPGFIPTSMGRNAMELSSAYAQGAERSPYSALYRKFQETMGRAAGASRYTPEDCARVVLRAIEDTPPRARYLVTRRAKIMSFMRRVMPDSAFDRGARKRLGLDQMRAALSENAKT